MVTTVGTETAVTDLLADLIQLDYDAADAYQAAIDRLDDSGFRTTLSAFKQDHLRHVSDLGEILREMGRTPPEEGDMKSLLTQGKVVVAGLMGDRAILEAMRTNEADTNTAYEQAVKHRDLTPAMRTALEQGLADERRHCSWVLQTLNTMRS